MSELDRSPASGPRRAVVPVLLVSAMLLTACGTDQASPEMAEADPPSLLEQTRATVHRAGDDLLSAGLGLAGLMGPAPEIDQESGPESLRRLAMHNAWNALAALNPAGGVGGLLEDLPSVPGREWSRFAQLEGASQPFRVLLQVPDSFDPGAPCLVVGPASGSRGVYGAAPLVAPWALPRGCAVVYTDKAAGTDFHYYGDDSAVALDGRRVAADENSRPIASSRPDEQPGSTVFMPHAHSGDHVEADWGRHVLASIRIGLDWLVDIHDGQFDADAVRVIATGLSNGGGAALRAAELDEEGLIDAVVAVMPNISPPGTPHLFDYATLAALYQPCQLADLERLMTKPLGNPMLAAAGQARCQALHEAGLLDAPEPAQARQRLVDAGFDDAALALGTVNVILDLWRSVAVTYASAYLDRGPFDMPCDYRFVVSADDPTQRAAWWGSHSGIAPGGGIEISDGLASGSDPALPGLICLRELFEAQTREGEQLRAAIEATRASAGLPSIPVLLVHGRDDGLIPAVFSARPYTEQARANGAQVAYWEVDGVQHFDALLSAPGVAGRLLPILPFGWAGLDHIEAVLNGEHELSEDRHLHPSPAAAGQALIWDDLALN
ncbi:MAG: hypothetical protein JJU31_16775 [Wenzhouxiangella sp.]|nr:hypothetical protein [Wenzhouxiangella sp.]